jgi:DNA-directed RNA polymerase specialized sigma24 family protein
LRDELATLIRTRVRQACARHPDGDEGKATARWLRLTPGELARIESAIHGTAPAALAGGLGVISAAAIRRYAAEGMSQKEIARALGCNHYLVEKVLREQTTREILRLEREEGLTIPDIAKRLKMPPWRVRLVLVNADIKSALATAGDEG